MLTTQGSHWFSHTVALFTLALSGSHARPAIFTQAILLQVCQLCKVSGDHASSGIIKNPDTEVRPRLKRMNKSACVRSVNIHFPYVSLVQGERKSSQIKKQGGWFENEKSLCVSRAWSQTEVPRREAIEAWARVTEKSITFTFSVGGNTERN